MKKSRKIKILAFTDLHADKKALKELIKKAKRADILICAGDFTVFGRGMKEVLSKLDKVGKKVILVHGNHEDEKEVRKYCAKLKNVVFVHKKIHVDGEIAFIGHGGGGFSVIDDDFEKYVKKVKLPKGEKLVFVTHAPPYNTKIDYIWDHHGNKSYRRFIKKAKPLLAISGHLHETAGKTDKIGRTLLVNPGIKGKILEI